MNDKELANALRKRGTELQNVGGDKAQLGSEMVELAEKIEAGSEPMPFDDTSNIPKPPPGKWQPGRFTPPKRNR